MYTRRTVVRFIEDHVVVTENVYGGTYRYFEQIMTDYGFTFSYVDTSDLGQVESVFIFPLYTLTSL